MMSELIKIAPNGQWSLEKANNFPKHGVTYPDVYASTKLNHQKQLLTGPEQDAAHNDIHSYYKNHELPVKMMTNHATGQKEPHFLVQRGINDELGDWSPDGKTHNKLDWSTNPDLVTSHHHSVVASSDGEIAGDDGIEPGYVQGYNKGVHLKFWVPQSHIVGRRSHLGQHLAPGSQEYWSNPKEQEDSEANWSDHVLIRPGSFPLHSKTNWLWQDRKPGEEYGRMRRASVHLPKQK